MKLIGLYGMMESGKDEVASQLTKHHGYRRFSIGDYIRAEVGRGLNPINGFTPDVVRNTINQVRLMLKSDKDPRTLLDAKPTERRVRETLQWWGEYRRSQDAQYWNKMLAADLDIGNADGTLRAVVSDIRMPAEYHLIEDRGGQNWMVVRASCLNQRPYDGLHDHQTEVALRNYPFSQYIANNSSIEALKRLVQVLIREYEL